MYNILVGYDGSRASEAAVRQAIVLAAGLNARLHILRAVEPVGPSHEISLSQSDDPLAILDRRDAMVADPERELAIPEDDELAAVMRLCEDAGVPCYPLRLHGMASRLLAEQSIAMDLLVIGRHGTTSRRPVGSTTAALVTRPVVPTLVCRDEVAPWHRLLVAYDASPIGGRSLKLAGDIAARLNLDLDVLVAEQQGKRSPRTLDLARRALRAYHVDGEYLHQRGLKTDSIQSVALEMDSSVVVVPDGSAKPWTRSPSLTVNAALSLPGALTLVVP